MATNDTTILLLTKQTVHDVANYVLDQSTLTLPDTGNMDPSQTFPSVLADSGPATEQRRVLGRGPDRRLAWYLVVNTIH